MFFHDKLSEEEATRLFENLQNLHAREKLIKANMPYVVHLATNFRKKYWWNTDANKISLEDLINEGAIGLIRAIERFDVSKNTKFTSYSVRFIKQKFRKFVINQRLVRIPDYLFSKKNKLLFSGTSRLHISRLAFEAICFLTVVYFSYSLNRL